MNLHFVKESALIVKYQQSSRTDVPAVCHAEVSSSHCYSVPFLFF